MTGHKDTKSTNMEQVRTLVLGENNEQITKTVKANARDIVKDVISEAMHDRQQKDGSLSKTIVPMIESAVEQSIENNKANFVGYLYPIVGGLVRKSVTVFFNGFLEKLNSLIEYSLTFKGMKWRIAAWRQGIPFTRYIIKKTFIYRVEQVFFIHRETGLLLNHVVLENSQFNDANLVSAMLTAINDFMADSFNSNANDNLDTIKTENFTLAIQAGPDALLVAAISGSVPNDLKSHLQLTLENLHALYREELKQFDGDDSAFASSESHMRDCLLSEMSPDTFSQKKKPVFAIILVVAALFVFFGWCYAQWQQNAFIDSIWNAPRPAGMYLQKVEQTSTGIAIEYFRDPAAVSATNWLSENNIEVNGINLIEFPFVSLEPSVVLTKAREVLKKYPDIELGLDQNKLNVTGSSNRLFSLAEVAALKSIPGVSSIDQSSLTIPENNLTAKQAHEGQVALFREKMSTLAIQPVDFDVQSNSLTELAKSNLDQIAIEINTLNMLSKTLKTPIGIIISGYSDYTGSSEKNKRLSGERAGVVKQYLISRNIDPNILFAVGVGEVKIDAISNASRKVVFSTLYLANDIEKERQ